MARNRKCCVCFKFMIYFARLKVDFHLVQNVSRATFPFCLRTSLMEPSRNLFNFNAAVAHGIFCSKWKSSLTLNISCFFFFVFFSIIASPLGEAKLIAGLLTSSINYICCLFSHSPSGEVLGNRNDFKVQFSRSRREKRLKAFMDLKDEKDIPDKNAIGIVKHLRLHLTLTQLNFDGTPKSIRLFSEINYMQDEQTDKNLG